MNIGTQVRVEPLKIRSWLKKQQEEHKTNLHSLYNYNMAQQDIGTKPLFRLLAGIWHLTIRPTDDQSFMAYVNCGGSWIFRQFYTHD